MLPCQKCGFRDIEPGDRRCANCGTLLMPDPADFTIPVGQTVQQGSKPRNSPLWWALGQWKTLGWLAGLALVIFMAGGICAWLYYPRQVENERLVQVVVTATSTPTDTPTPGPSPTPSQTPIPTMTFTPSATPSPTPTVTPTPAPTDTPAESILPEGIPWRQSAVTLHVQRFIIDVGACGDVFNTLPMFAHWEAVLQNHTDSDLLINLDEEDFFLTSDSGEHIWFNINQKNTCTGGLNLPVLKAGQEVLLRGWGLGHGEHLQVANDYVFGAYQVGDRIKNARFKLQVPR